MFGFGDCSARCRERQAELDVRLGALEKKLAAHRLEMIETQDKVYVWMKRTEKRVRDEARAAAPGDGGGEPEQPTAPTDRWGRRAARPGALPFAAQALFEKRAAMTRGGGRVPAVGDGG